MSDITTEGIDTEKDWEYIPENYVSSEGIIYDTVTADVETITADVAQSMLDKMAANRRMKKKRVEELKLALQNGEWQLNGETIKVSSTGLTLDGQHRLTACVATGIPFDAIVVRGLECGTQQTVDLNAVRSLTDTLRIMHGNGELVAPSDAKGKVKSSFFSRLAAALNSEFMFANGTLQNNQKLAPSRTQALDLLAANPDIVEMVADLDYLISADVKFPPGPAIALYNCFETINRADCNEFFSALAKGTKSTDDGDAMLPANHPIALLRMRLLDAKTKKEPLNHRQLLALTIKAWNAFRAGETPKRLSWKAGGASAEDFPTAA